jgi:hypothetical protein
MSSTFTPDGHAFILAVGGGQLWNRWETSTGAWSGWGVFFPGSSMSLSPIDVDAASTNGVAAQVFTLHAAGQVRTRRKLGTWNAPWENEVDLGVVQSGNALAVGTTGGYQQVFVSTPTTVQTRWETSPGSNSWVGWTDFSAGLPAGMTWLDLTAGLDGLGRMDVVLLGRDAAGARRLYRRTKTSADPGSAWGAWGYFTDALPFSTQVELAPMSSALAPGEVGERLFTLNDGELVVFDPRVIDPEWPNFQASWRWVPASMPEPIPSQPLCP